MSIFSVLSGGSSSDSSQQQQQQREYTTVAGTDNTATPPSADQNTAVSAGGSYYPYTATPPSAAQPSRPVSTPQTADDMYGGVNELLKQVDFSSDKMNPVVSPGGIEYLSLEDGPTFTDGVMPSRGWSDDLCYGTGTMYILGLTTGGAWGFMEGMRSQHGSRSFKLRLNSVLNSMTRRGPFIGNSVGILAMFYNSINSMIGGYRGVRDHYNNIGAAALSGMLFKIGSGPRTSLISALICAGTVGVYQASIAAYSNYKVKRISEVTLSPPPEPQLSSTTPI
ncbi:Tim17-domain-containing protein [Coemansia reversa NRRL 1564]|uniref:Tim17-domain-containing protein n=1 Tax=Coemansia reversa (strain ATCC 12441 / NRRL 1564) TaxID=763665 RepID=A0A2G5BDD4_COERN|nr:Tim17-domain-containing protein [Coemansia reversa NRRL 1564]|eukprot:PIA17026.1 Tim17-domain-containing protein [Coemansia reversa NRRL 1564]